MKGKERMAADEPRPERVFTSMGFTLAAMTRTSSSSAMRSGTATSARCSSSAAPSRSTTSARMVSGMGSGIRPFCPPSLPAALLVR